MSIDINKILSVCDHTLLKQDCTWEQIKTICDEGIEYSTASVCIPASFVKRAASYSEGRVPICTVIGFPNGYSTTEAKCFEAADAVKNGADEIDMVINIGDLKEKNYSKILDEINRVKNACGDKLLKVIIETCLLTDDEKIKMCEIINESNADYIKTSTGFSTSGATPEDIILFASHINPPHKIKAAGGISTLEDAELFIKLGADRLGTSRIVNLVRNKTNTQEGEK